VNVFYSFQSCGNTWCCLFFKYGFYLRCELQCRWFLNEYVTSIARIIQMVASLSTQRKDCRNAACPTTSHTQTGLGLKLDLRLDTLTTNLLRHDTSSSLWRYHYLLTRKNGSCSSNLVWTVNTFNVGQNSDQTEWECLCSSSVPLHNFRDKT